MLRSLSIRVNGLKKTPSLISIDQVKVIVTSTSYKWSIKYLREVRIWSERIRLEGSNRTGYSNTHMYDFTMCKNPYIFLLIWISIKTICSYAEVFDRYSGYHILSGMLESIPCGPTDYCTVTTCSSHCRCNAACVVINYNTVTSVCQLHDASVLYSNATVEENVPEWIILEPPYGR